MTSTSDKASMATKSGERWRQLAIGLLTPLAFLTPTSLLAAPPEPKVTIEAIRARFLYERSGTLSDDLVSAKTFLIWNTVSGAGDAVEPASDLLVSVVLRAGDGESLAHGRLVLTVRSGSHAGRGKILARRTFREMLLTHGTVVESLFLPDSTCDGPITIEASYGAQRRTAAIELACGE